MICYLVRHGQDDETLRGGWGNQPLTAAGIRQAEELADKIGILDIQHLYSSDLCRAFQTAQILSKKLHLKVIPLSQFREVNNGVLAGMKNEIACTRYPGLFWNQLSWEQCYPEGESPKLFYERIYTAWEEFSKKIIAQDEDAVLITHGGVIHVILSIVQNKVYSNKEKHPKVSYTEIITLEHENNNWRII